MDTTTVAEEAVLRIRLETQVRELEADERKWEALKVTSIGLARTYEQAQEAAFVWDALIGQRRFALRILRAVLAGVEAPDPIDIARAVSPLADWTESELRYAHGDR